MVFRLTASPHGRLFSFIPMPFLWENRRRHGFSSVRRFSLAVRSGRCQHGPHGQIRVFKMVMAASLRDLRGEGAVVAGDRRAAHCIGQAAKVWAALLGGVRSAAEARGGAGRMRGLRGVRVHAHRLPLPGVGGHRWNPPACGAVTIGAGQHGVVPSRGATAAGVLPSALWLSIASLRWRPWPGQAVASQRNYNKTNGGST